MEPPGYPLRMTRRNWPICFYQIVGLICIEPPSEFGSMENRMRKLLLTVGLLGSAVCGAQGADLLTKAPAPAVAPSCFASVASYFQASAQECPLTWNGITLYGTIDTGGGYQTHGVPF